MSFDVYLQNGRQLIVVIAYKVVAMRSGGVGERGERGGRRKHGHRSRPHPTLIAKYGVVLLSRLYAFVLSTRDACARTHDKKASNYKSKPRMTASTVSSTWNRTFSVSVFFSGTSNVFPGFSVFVRVGSSIRAAWMRSQLATSLVVK